MSGRERRVFGTGFCCCCAGITPGWAVGWGREEEWFWSVEDVLIRLIVVDGLEMGVYGGGW